MTVPFSAPPWLKSGHLQTIWGAIAPAPEPLPPGQRLKVPVDDENTLLCRLNQASSDSQQPNDRCLVLVHGLESSAEAPYIVSTARKALADGWDVARMNMRACGGSLGHCATPYHGGMSGDALALANALAQRGYTRIVLAGFSLGGHVLLKLAGELGADAPDWLKGIVAVSAPVELEAASRSLMQPSNRIYERYFYRQLVDTYRARRRIFPERTSLAVLKKVRNLYDFDNLITAPLFGFKDAVDYYTQNSALALMSKIKIPVKIIIAKDDPFIPYSSHLKAMQLENPCLSWQVSAGGGHVGFFNSPALSARDRDERWSENRLLEAAAAWV